MSDRNITQHDMESMESANANDMAIGAAHAQPGTENKAMRSLIDLN